jgi:hypothetical protein
MPQFLPGKTGNPGGRPKGAVQIRDLARKHTAAAINRLVAIMENAQSEAASVMAANSLLDRGWGKPIAHSKLEGVKGGVPIVFKISKDDANL